MPSFMAWYCGQPAYNVWVSLRKERAAFPSQALHSFFTHSFPVFILLLNTTFTQLLRRLVAEFSSVTAYLYPLSPGPITKTTKYTY